MSTYSRVRASGLANRTPCQPSDTCGPDTPRPSRKRPPDSVSRVAAVIAVIAGDRGRAGRLHAMQQRPLGRSGLLVSRLALGTMTWGRDTAPDDAAAQLKTFREAGGTLVDTADVYGDGDAEAVLGTLLDALVPRDELIIASK